MALVELSFESVNGRTDARPDGRTDDGQKVITVAHPEHSSDELKRVGYNEIFCVKLHTQL